MKRTALFFLLPVLGALPAAAQSIPAYAIPNSKHYRESGVGNATGRGGTAQLTARALLGADGNTTVEVTTGALDSSATPPGSFGKVQFKPLTPDGDALFAKNFTPLSTPTGYYSFLWPSLGRHQQAQIQANINGIDHRTDVVTLVETVKLRPDLAVQKLTLPDSPLVDTPVNITANVVELNGDSSATTTCQLFIDGTLADQANNVYVDAAGGVTCAFTHTFDTTGSHTIQVTAANVIPADWDTSNNSASGTINIVSLNTNFAEHGFAKFHDQKGGFPLSQMSSQQAWLAGSQVYANSNTTGSTGEEQDSQTKFWSGGNCAPTNAATYQFPVDIAYSETMDGTSVYTAKATGITGNTKTFPTNQFLCGSHVVSMVQQTGSGVANDHTFHVITKVFYDSSSNPIETYQEVSTARNAGDVTYVSFGYQCEWFSDCNNPPTNYHYWNTSNETVLGTIVALGNTWTPSATVTDSGGNGFGGSLSVSLIPTQITSGKPLTCSTTGPDQWGYTYQNCSSSATNYMSTDGSANY